MWRTQCTPSGRERTLHRSWSGRRVPLLLQVTCVRISQRALCVAMDDSELQERIPWHATTAGIFVALSRQLWS